MQHILKVALFATIIAMVTCQGQKIYRSDPGGLAPVEGQSNVQGVNTGGSQGRGVGGGNANYPGQASPGSSNSGNQQSANAIKLQQMMMVPSQFPATSNQQYPITGNQQYPLTGNQGVGTMDLFGASSGGNSNSGGGGNNLMSWFMFGDMMQDPLMCGLMGQPLSNCMMGNMLFN